MHKLYHITYGPLHGVCRRYLNDADEISQLLNTGFLKIINGLSAYRMSVPFEAWIKRIMINTVIDHHRKHKKYKEIIQYTDDVPEPPRASLDLRQADQLFDADQLLQLVKKLPPMTGKVFNLAAIDGYSHKEISSMLNISEGTSKWHLSHGRKLLQDMMASIIQSKKKPNRTKFNIQVS